MELEWKWNGTFMKKFGDEKWNGNREEMEWKNYEGIGRSKVEWKQRGNGKERKIEQ